MLIISINISSTRLRLISRRINSDKDQFFLHISEVNIRVRIVYTFIATERTNARRRLFFWERMREKEADLRLVWKSLRNRAPGVNTKRMLKTHLSFFPTPRFSPFLSLSFYFSSSFPFFFPLCCSPKVSAHGASYSEYPAVVLCNFLFDFSRRSGREGSNRFTILANEFLEVAFPRLSRLSFRVFVPFSP